MGTFSLYPLLSLRAARMEQGGDFPSQGCAWLPELHACRMLGETLPSAAQHGACSTGTPRHHHQHLRAPAVGCFTRTPVLWGQRAFIPFAVKPRCRLLSCCLAQP